MPKLKNPKKVPKTRLGKKLRNWRANAPLRKNLRKAEKELRKEAKNYDAMRQHDRATDPRDKYRPDDYSASSNRMSHLSSEIQRIKLALKVPKQ